MVDFGIRGGARTASALMTIETLKLLCEMNIPYFIVTRAILFLFAAYDPMDGYMGTTDMGLDYQDMFMNLPPSMSQGLTNQELLCSTLSPSNYPMLPINGNQSSLDEGSSRQRLMLMKKVSKHAVECSSTPESDVSTLNLLEYINNDDIDKSGFFFNINESVYNNELVLTNVI
jgi:hypothetical protein